VCSSKKRLRLRQVTSISPRAGDGRRVHGRERRRHLHGELVFVVVVMVVIIVVPGNGRSERLQVFTERMSDGKSRYWR
jgi:hypothetical protein